ncbi:MAG: ABC transporter [Bacteroidetes bacterium RIFCSPLOWO2_12_FULL_35_15]|nr:MAG: ABC transporter [Bacteroidetes bacterium RIFCSPLOWO2_12_FULL_35_15]
MASFVKENIKISLGAIRSQLLRTILTALIISIGIAALVGILAAIDAMKSSINSNFTSMGANTFTIRNREMGVRIGSNGKKPKRFRSITYDEAIRFCKEYSFPAKPSVATFASMNATMKYGSKKTNPNIRVFGGDENYLATSGYDLEAGRNFSAQEILYGNHVVILGKDALDALFNKKEDPIDKVITIGSGKYKVIGILKSKGNSMGFGGDKIGVLPLNNVRQYFSIPNMTYTINVLVTNSQLMDAATNEATGVFRTIRKVNIGEDNNFEITKSDNLANLLIDNIQKVTAGATLIGIITLLGAAIGLMNIMLVSVTERTREIGIRKAMGATKKLIRSQFLVEAIVICQIGGLFGILLGIIIGILTSYLFGVGFVLPWVWIISGIILCMFVGLISGLYPAVKASKLDPIDALRFE